MKELKEQIAKIYCLSRGWPWRDGSTEQADTSRVYADEILNLPIAEGKLWVEKECDCQNPHPIIAPLYEISLCPSCQGTGIIRKLAVWGDISVDNVSADGHRICFETPDGGKLVWEEK